MIITHTVFSRQINQAWAQPRPAAEARILKGVTSVCPKIHAIPKLVNAQVRRKSPHP
jgi:hypothetical protein